MKPSEIANLREKFVAESFALDGYTVHQVKHNRHFYRSKKHPMGRWLNIGEDIFCSDIIAKKHGSKTVWVQVTSGFQLKKKVETYKRLKCFDLMHDDLLIIMAIKQKSFPELLTEEVNIISAMADKYDLDMLTMLETTLGIKWLTYGIINLSFEFVKLGNFWLPESLLKIIINHKLI